MPHHTRAQLQQKAWQMRQAGESVVLLFSNKDTTSRATPLDIIAASSPEPINQDSEKTIWAKVAWLSNEVVGYEEGGRTHNLAASIEANICNRELMSQCYAVRLSRGVVLRKTAERLSDGRTAYIIDVAGTDQVGD